MVGLYTKRKGRGLWDPVARRDEIGRDRKEADEDGLLIVVGAGEFLGEDDALRLEDGAGLGEELAGEAQTRRGCETERETIRPKTGLWPNRLSLCLASSPRLSLTSELLPKTGAILKSERVVFAKEFTGSDYDKKPVFIGLFPVSTNLVSAGDGIPEAAALSFCV